MPTTVGAGNVEADATSRVRPHPAQHPQQQPSGSQGEASQGGPARKRQRVAANGQAAKPPETLTADDPAAGAGSARLEAVSVSEPQPAAATAADAAGDAKHASPAASIPASQPQRGSTAPQHKSDARKQAAAAASPGLPPSRPMEEFLAVSAGRPGEDSFRVLCQVGLLPPSAQPARVALRCSGRLLSSMQPPSLALARACRQALSMGISQARTFLLKTSPRIIRISTTTTLRGSRSSRLPFWVVRLQGVRRQSCVQVLGYLRAAHARGRALGRLRPAALRVTSSCIVLLDVAAVVPAEEDALYSGQDAPPPFGPLPPAQIIPAAAFAVWAIWVRSGRRILCSDAQQATCARQATCAVNLIFLATGVQ